MALVRATDTKPEMKVRRAVHRAGYRYRLHRKDLPGKPDLVFPSRRAIVFVHGCFWHRHADPDCKLSRLPKSRPDFWIPKLTKNAERDTQAVEALERLGWRVLVVWECELKDIERVVARIAEHLERCMPS
jgi:DNA mismatch endonuclease (patch repair protein)